MKRYSTLLVFRECKWNPQKTRILTGMSVIKRLIQVGAIKDMYKLESSHFALEKVKWERHFGKQNWDHLKDWTEFQLEPAILSYL